MSKLGDTILRLRTARRMSLQDVADESNLTKAHIWELEKGRSKNPTVATLLGIGCALEFSPIKLAGAAFEDLPDVTTRYKGARNKRA